jgi:hypothetical protein
MNRFVYVHSNPASLIDPTGHGVDCEIGQACDPELREDDAKRLRKQQEKARKEKQKQKDDADGGRNDGDIREPPDLAQSVAPQTVAASEYSPPGDVAPADYRVAGLCWEVQGMVGIYGGISVCSVYNHMQVSARVGAGPGIGASTGYSVLTTDATSARSLSGWGGGAGGSVAGPIDFGPIVIGEDRQFSRSGDSAAVNSVTDFAGLGVGWPVEGHAYGSFTIDLDDRPTYPGGGAGGGFPDYEGPSGVAGGGW